MSDQPKKPQKRRRISTKSEGAIEAAAAPGETRSVQSRPRVPSDVGEFEELVHVSDPAAQEAAKAAVTRWMKTFTPGPQGPDAQGTLNRVFLEKQMEAIATGAVPLPPPLSTDGLALQELNKLTKEKYDLTTLKVQQEILQIIGRKRQKLVEVTASRLLILERCIASNFAFNAFGITKNIKVLLTDLLFSGQLSQSFMDVLARFISTDGGFDIIMNPTGWFASNLGFLVTANAVNTYIAIWLSNQLIGAQIFAQMTHNKELNEEINKKGRDLLDKLQDDETFFDQMITLSSEIATLFNKATANLMAIISTGFNLPEIFIGRTVVTGEQMLAEIPIVLHRFVNESVRQTQDYARLEEERRGMARDVAIQYRDAPEVARLVVQAAPTTPGLPDLTKQIISELIRAIGQLIRSALVLFGMRTSQPTDVIIRINNRIADTLVGSYLGYMQKLGDAIGEMPDTAPVQRPPPRKLTERQSGEIVEDIFEGGNEKAAADIAGLIDRRVAEINPAAVEQPCPRRFSIWDMPYSQGQLPTAAATAPADPEEEEVETQPLFLSQESFLSAKSGSPTPPSTGGGRKRKHHSTRSSKSSKSSKSSTRKHGKSKRAKKSGAKTRHMRLAPGAGRRTRKHKHSKRGRK